MLNQNQPSFRYMLDKLPPFLAKSDRNKKKRTKMIGFANVSSFLLGFAHFHSFYLMLW